MLLDAGELNDFYQTPLGRVVRRLIALRVRRMWPNAEGQVILGHGFAVPYLAHFHNARHLAALMPAAQGALRWPAERPSQTLLADNEHLPIADNSVDGIVAVHSLEGASDPHRLLREFWRVLRGEGRIIAAVPNRRGVWARADSTPFGSGHPYSRGQLDKLLRDALFEPITWHGALYTPPLSLRFLSRAAPSIERTGTVVWPAFSGVMIVEVQKQLMAPIGGARVVRAGAQLETAGLVPRNGNAE